MSIQIATGADIQTCFDIRTTVFVDEQGFSPETEPDELDPQAIQLLLRQDGRPVATARLLRDGATGKIGRICVLRDWRGTGLGADLVRFGLAHFRTVDGVTQVDLGAQVRAIGFYEGLGFTAYGPEYDDEGVPHQMMRAPL